MADLKAELEKLKNLKLTKEQQQALVLGVVLIGGLVYGYWNYVLKPLNTSIATLTEQARTKRENIEKARRLKAQWEEYNQRMSRVQLAEAYVARRMPPPGEITAAVARMIRLTLEGSVNFGGYAAEDKGGAGTKSEFEGFDKKISAFVLTGGYHQLGAFLSKLTGEDLVFSIEDVRLTALAPSMHGRLGSSGIAVKIVTYSESAAVKK